MKNILKTIAIALIVILGSACEKWIDPEINKDPDSPEDVELSLILPSIQVQIAYIMGGFNIAGISSMWMQTLIGNDRQAAAIYSYNMKDEDANSAWNSLYSGPLTDIEQMIKKAETPGKESWDYAGVGKIMKAYTMGTITSLWGSAPFSDAFQGSKNLTPQYDSQREIYDGIQKLLDDAIIDLQKTENNLFELENDLIYDNDVDKWIRVAYTLKARYYLHTSKRSGNAAYNAILKVFDLGITSYYEDCKFLFGTNESEWNPLYQFSLQRIGDAYVNQNFINLIGDDNDPRYSFFYSAQNSDLLGGPYYGSANSRVVLISHTEALFIRAEANFRLGNLTDAVNDYKSAVISSLSSFGIPPVSWYNKIDNETESTLTLEKIIDQKYVALYMQTEVYCDYRRTGFPSLTPIPNTATNNTIPARFPYPNDEKKYNAKNCPSVLLTDKLWAFQ